MSLFLKNNLNKIKNKAFTLVEVMVAIILTTIVLGTAFTIWSRIQRNISISNTKQRLQNELRKVANFMQNDFKSIKASGTFQLTQSSDTNFTMTFEKFKELKADEKKLAQDVTEKVTYELKNNMLTRTVGNKQILTLNCDGINIERTVNKDQQGDANLSNDDKDFFEGRKAKLDITITGKMKVPGVNLEEYHVEKTSIVMRDEYNKNINKTYLSNFDLIQKEVNDIVLSGDSNNFGGGELNYEYLITLNNEALDAVEETQKDYKAKTEENLTNCNKQIEDTETGQGFWRDIFTWNTPEDKVEDWRDNLAKANTKSEVIAVKQELEEFKGDKDIDFMNKSTNGLYQSMSAEEKEIYEIAYNMRVQDRQAEKAYKKQQDDKKEGDPDPEPITRMIDIYQNQAKQSNEDIKDDKGNVIDVSVSGTNNQNTDTAKINKVVAAYNSLDVEWMDGDKYEQDLNTYAAAKSLISLADTKADIIDTLNMYNENLNKINEARGDSRRPKD